MKMKPEDYRILADKIKPLDTVEAREGYAKNSNSTRAYQWYLVIKSGSTKFLCDTLYTYLDDNHIQTALNKIVPPLR